jgi:hypothetical protein
MLQRLLRWRVHFSAIWTRLRVGQGSLIARTASVNESESAQLGLFFPGSRRHTFIGVPIAGKYLCFWIRIYRSDAGGPMPCRMLFTHELLSLGTADEFFAARLAFAAGLLLRKVLIVLGLSCRTPLLIQPTTGRVRIGQHAQIALLSRQLSS